MIRHKVRKKEQGFALLFVFLLAASIAISFYIMLPSAAFESQRIVEQTLIDRGEQYRRAIQLYYRKFNRYPTDISALEDTNSIRFLRRRYKDPMTGTDDWRLIHMSSAGVLSDSLISKSNTKEDEGKSQNTFITEGPSVGTTFDTGSAVIPNWRRRRGGTGTEGSGQTDPYAMPGMETPQTTAGVSTGVQQTSTGDTGSSGQQTSGQTSATTSTSGDATVQLPVDRIRGITLPSTQTMQTATSGSTSYIGGSTTSSTSSSSTSQTTSTQQSSTGSTQTSLSSLGPNQATSFISSSLTTTSTTTSSSAGRTTTLSSEQFGGGLAGVATKYQAESIKLYNERQKYQEWEFVYDYRNDRMNAAATGTALPSKVGTPTTTKSGR